MTDDSKLRPASQLIQDIMNTPNALNQMNFDLEPRMVEIHVPRPAAENFQVALSESIAEAEQELQEDEILAVYHTGAGEPIFLREVDYGLPDLIILKGADASNNRCTVLVNMHAVQIVLKAVKRPTHIERRPIGFATKS